MAELGDARWERMLSRVEKPSRYINHEIGSVHKERTEGDISVLLIYPDLYEVGISNLGLSILYQLLNKMDGVVCERAYAPARDLEEELRREGLPLFSLESRCPVSDFDIVGFTLQWELTYTNILNMLDLGGLPLPAADRGPQHPLIIGGGPCAFNPEPLADFFDLFFLGEAEEALSEMMELVRARRDDKKQLLRELAKIQGCYVPSLYQVDYQGEQIAAIRPVDPEAPYPVKKRVIADLDELPAPVAPIIPYVGAVHDRAVIEAFRGCSRGCRFCQAGMIYRPVRERSVEYIRRAAVALTEQTGHEEISLTSLSTCDYSDIQGLLKALSGSLAPRNVDISLPSLRADSFSVELSKSLSGVRKSGITFAPEAGSERMRQVINKSVREEELLSAARMAFRSGWDRIKLYFMIGLPGETDSDLEEIGKLASKVVEAGKEELPPRRRGRLEVTVNVSTFVPKAHTPFQWFGQAGREEIRQKQDLLQRLVGGRNLRLKLHDPLQSGLEGLIARGDRRMGAALLAAWRLGCRFDGWQEQLRWDLWDEALRQTGMAADASHERGPGEPLPWDHLSAGLTKEFLFEEYRRAMEGIPTPDCRAGDCRLCDVCGNLGVDINLAV